MIRMKSNDQCLLKNPYTKAIQYTLNPFRCHSLRQASAFTVSQSTRAALGSGAVLYSRRSGWRYEGEHQLHVVPRLRVLLQKSSLRGAYHRGNLTFLFICQDGIWTEGEATPSYYVLISSSLYNNAHNSLLS